MLNITDRPGIEESYTSATNTSDLTIVAAHRGSGDTIIAAGWSKSRIGAALLRLHSEWDHSSHPAKPSPERIAALAASLDAGTQNPTRVAEKQAHEWYMHELGLLFQALKTLPAVRTALIHQSILWSIGDPENKVASVIRWWLDQTCTTCDGVRWQLVPGTSRSNGRPCLACHGAGISQVPAGRDGRRIACYMDECVEVARSSIRSRLQTMHRKD